MKSLINFHVRVSYLAVAVLPKRERSSRKAKDNASRKYLSAATNDDDEEGAIPGLDLSDSDDDATWTPFKAAKAGEDDEEYGDHGLDGLGRKNILASIGAGSKSGFKKLKTPQDPGMLPAPTQLVPEGRDPAIGDFLVLKSDINRDSAPIWR